MIGKENRFHLRNLEIGMIQPEQVWQYSDGTRTSRESWMFRRVLPCYRHPREISENITEGIVDNVDPAIEVCFRILGKDGPAVTLVISLPTATVPGVQSWYDEQRPDRNRWSMELPDITETFKQDYTGKSRTQCCIEVLWKGDYPRMQSRKSVGGYWRRKRGKLATLSTSHLCPARCLHYAGNH